MTLAIRASLEQRPAVAMALTTALVGLLCLVFESALPGIAEWPDALQLPLSDWVGAGATWALEGVKPAARLLSALMAYPMQWANALLVGTPWPITIGLVTALGWHIGGLRMAALGLIGLSLVLASGYWVESMNTLALVSVSVPLALLAGGSIGILAYELPRVRRAVLAVLDVMQTVPTFAYLTPLLLLFGFGPVVGLIASAIYAAPPMARNVLLGLERVDPDVKEAAVMSGGTRLQQLFLVELPAALTQIMVGVNQSLMAALSMVIIAAVIGGFDDIGWEVLLTMRKAQFGQSLLAGLVIVVFAILIDRMSGALARDRVRHDRRGIYVILGLTAVALLLLWQRLPQPGELALFAPMAEGVDQGLGAFTAEHGASLDAFKNTVTFFLLLPLRIGLDNAVLPFTWGFAWTEAMSLWFFVAAILVATAFALRGRPLLGAMLLPLAVIVETGIAELPWPFVLAGVGAVGWLSGGRRMAIFAVAMLGAILISGLWERALLSVYLSGISVIACAVFGGALGLLCAVSPMAWRLVRPVCDMLQTIPLFVFLIPVLMFFQIGEFSAFLAICAYAIVPMIRYTQHGLTTTPEELLDAATTSGATPWQTMVEVRMPYAMPTILLGLNQTILYAFAMLVIAALIGTTGLGQSIFLALGQADVGLGITAGAAMAILALVADRLVQGFAEERRRALGL
ncbi:MAG: ABC transporter permease subunit [Pseudomonadota bacterium]